VQDFEQRDRRAIHQFIKTHVKPESEMLQMGLSKSRSILGGGPIGNGKNIIHGNRGDNLKISLNNMLNGMNDDVEAVSKYSNQVPSDNQQLLQNSSTTGTTSRTRQNMRRSKKYSNTGNMDLLKKFRYNFNYWLKNCYQPAMNIEEHKKEIY